MLLTVGAQQPRDVNTTLTKRQEADKRIDDYLKLVKMGYSEQEIFEDLGNANFLMEHYETAAFWYQKLIDLSDDQSISSSYYERYQFAMAKAKNAETPTMEVEKDWVSVIKKDYQIKKENQRRYASASPVSKYREIDFAAINKSQSLDELKQLVLASEREELVTARTAPKYSDAYDPPIAVTSDGRTAYFSKAVYVKPLYGLFSKKQKMYKIYKANRVNGQWTNINEVAVCPKYASAVHPAISEDGKRLFFASDMPGSYGNYDIYVAELQSTGQFGTAHNLGSKVNSVKDDLYPNLVNGTLLFFASDGRDGYGGLDLYATQIAKNEIGPAINLGSPINSKKDDFSIALMTDRGMGYVMSNRGKANEDVRQLVFSYDGAEEQALLEKADHEYLNVVNNSLSTGYTNTLFQD
jgi:tetratricopeptide (TPR) repeat protein